MTLMVVFAIGDESFALALALLFCSFGKKSDGVLVGRWDIADFCGSRLRGMDSNQNEGMRDMCTYGSFLSLYQNTENVISLLVLSLPV